jgi:hypothetical protein
LRSRTRRSSRRPARATWPLETGTWSCRWTKRIPTRPSSRRSHRDLLAVLGARDSASDGTDARATTDGLTALHRALNRHDPFYRYDFAVGDDADRDAFVLREPPRTLAFSAQISDGHVCVTWHVHARCAESVRERPIPINLLFNVDNDPELAESLRLFADYGKPFSAPNGVLDCARARTVRPRGPRPPRAGPGPRGRIVPGDPPDLHCRETLARVPARELCGQPGRQRRRSIADAFIGASRCLGSRPRSPTRCRPHRHRYGEW